MATLRFSLGPPGNAMQTAVNSAVDAAGEHTTSGTASFVEAGGADIEATGQQLFVARADGAVWLRFGGSAAAVGADHYIPADETRVIQVTQKGKISVIDDS